MTPPHHSRYERVSRRAVLKGSIGSGVLALTAAACGNADAEVLAGNVAQPAPTTTTTTTTTTEPPPTTASSAPADEAAETTIPTQTPAVAGEMVIAFTYMRVGEGQLESPYVAVWIEDSNGDLLQTVGLFYEQTRRGARWLDHLDRWFTGDAARLADGRIDTSTTISSATRPPGEYAVTWDGTVDGTPAPAGTYFVCIESAREDGPYSLIRQPLVLEGTLVETTLTASGELSAASVQINV